MKKLLVALFAVAMVAGLAAQLTPAISGDGSATWGYNLNNNKHGFQNGADLTIDIPLVEGGVATKSSTGEGNYGAASVVDVALNLSIDAEDTAPAFDAVDLTITATVYVGPLSVQVYSAPGIGLDNALVFSPFQDDDADFDATTWSTNVAPGVTTNGGLTLGYMIGELGSVSVAVASLGDWTVANADDRYAFQAGLTLTPMENASVTAGVLFDGASETTGASVSLSMKPIDMLTVAAAFDLSMVAGTTGYDAAASVAAALTEKDSVKAALYYSAGAAGDGSEVDVMLSFADAEGFVPGLSLGASVFAMELMADPAKDPMWLGVAQNLSYKLALSDAMTITPYENLVMDLSNEKTYLSVGATIVPFANTTIGVDFTMGATGNKTFPGTGFVGTGMDTDKGVLTVTTTVAF